MISIVIQGVRFYHSKRSVINVSMDTVSNIFSMDISDRWSQDNLKRQILPYDPCQVFINDFKLIDGYVDKVNPQIDSTSNMITISARDKTGDLIDCSAVHRTGQWIGLKLDKIITEICQPFGIKVTVATDVGAPLPYFNIEQGTSAFEAIEKLCSLRGLIAIADNNGGILITRASEEKINYSFIEGINIEEGSANYDGSQRFSQITVKGQALSDDTLTGEVGFSGSGTVTDKNIPRYRPLVILESAQINSGTCQTIAKWELAKRRGKSRSFKITKQNLLQDDGTLWPINKIVHLKSDYLGVDDDLLIAGVEYHSDNKGDYTVFTLTPKEAYQIIPDLSLEKPRTQDSLTGNQYISV